MPLSKPKNTFLKNGCLLGMTLLVSVLLMESVIRVSINRKWRWTGLLESVHAYWNYVCDADPRLCAAFNANHNPTLGWSQAPYTDSNPLGLSENSRKGLEAPGRKILFYGESFVRGAASRGFQLPVYLDKRLPDQSVIDLSVPAFGLDQVLLLLRRTFGSPGVEQVLIGLNLMDFSLTRMEDRGHPKPYFDVVGENLVLRNRPLSERTEGPPPLLLLPFARAALTWFEDQKENRHRLALIFNELETLCRQAHVPLAFVLFHDERTLAQTHRLEIFFKGELERIGVPYLDTKPILIRGLQARGLPLAAAYKQGDGHHNDLGNGIIGDALVDFVSGASRSGTLTRQAKLR